MTIRTLAISMAVALGMSVPLSGHHSYAALYVEEDTIEIEGEIVEVQFRAPHAWIHVVAEDAFRRQRTYAAEWSNPSRLERDGITKNTLRAGDIVRIWASPGRALSEDRVHLKRIVRRRDGWQWNPSQRETR